MKIIKKYKKYLFICLLAAILLFNSYRKAFVLEGYSGGSKDINKKFLNLDEKFEGIKRIAAGLQTEIKLIKATINNS